MINPNIFRQNDIRGIWEKDFNSEDASRIIRAIYTYLVRKYDKKSLKVSLGMDARLSSPTIEKVALRALKESGAEVWPIGICPVPVGYFSVYKHNLDANIMITASHNPPEFNGFKITGRRGSVFAEEIKEIAAIVAKDNFLYAKGLIKKVDLRKEYVNYLVDRFPRFKGIKVAFDAGNGTVGLILPEILEKLAVDYEGLYLDPNGHFPNHIPDPIVRANLEDLIKTVKEKDFDLGFAYDGDGDRLGVVDRGGEIIWGDQLMIIFSQAVLREHPGAKIIGEVKCSQVMYDEIKRLGGQPIMWKTGHSFLKEKLNEEKAFLAGEMSGHLFFADKYFGYDDAIYASLRLLEIIFTSGKPYQLSKFLQHLPLVFNSPEIRSPCPDEFKLIVVAKMKEIFKNYPSSTIDGIRIRFPEGWALLRASNTQPILVMRFEAKTKEGLEKIRQLMENKLEEVKRRTIK